MDSPGTLEEMLAKGRRPYGLKRCRVFEREGLEGERELRLEDLAHERRDGAAFQTVESDFAHAGLGVGEEALDGRVD